MSGPALQAFRAMPRASDKLLRGVAQHLPHCIKPCFFKCYFSLFVHKQFAKSIDAALCQCNSCRYLLLVVVSRDCMCVTSL